MVTLASSLLRFVRYKLYYIKEYGLKDRGSISVVERYGLKESDHVFKKYLMLQAQTETQEVFEHRITEFFCFIRESLEPRAGNEALLRKVEEELREIVLLAADRKAALTSHNYAYIQ